MIEFKDLKVYDNFEDTNIINNEELSFMIIGDHIYTITDGLTRLIICGDKGNGHGVVLKVIIYDELYEDEKLNKGFENDN